MNTEFGQNENRLPRAYLSLAIGVVVIGFSAILLRLADAPGPVSGFFRMAIGGLALTPWALKRWGKQSLTLKIIRPAIAAGVALGLDLALWTTGVVLVGATIPTLMGNTAPLWVGLGALVFFKEKLAPVFWLGLAVAFTGGGLIVGQGGSQGEFLLEGVLLGLGSAVFYGAYFLAAQRGRETIEPLTFLWVVSLVCSLLLLIVTRILGQSLTGYPLTSYLVFLVMGLAVQVGGWLLISDAQGVLPASLVSPTLLGQPVLTAVFAAPLLGEHLTGKEIIGGLIVIIGIYIVHRSKQHEKENE